MVYYLLTVAQLAVINHGSVNMLLLGGIWGITLSVFLVILN